MTNPPTALELANAAAAVAHAYAAAAHAKAAAAAFPDAAAAHAAAIPTITHIPKWVSDADLDAPQAQPDHPARQAIVAAEAAFNYAREAAEMYRILNYRALMRGELNP